MYITSSINPSALPKSLVAATQVAGTQGQRDMLMLSLLTAAGYAMPNYFVRHGLPAHTYYPSLMTLVIAPPASGKGVMNLSRRLLQPIQDEKRKEAEELHMMAEDLGTDEHVPEKTAFIPANSSNNAFLHLLADNDGRGYMQETEMDVLTQVWKRDYGNYSAAFRQAFEHETISKARKTKGDEFLEVEHPALSVVLSGTLNQLKPLLESRENGLASRFLTYVTEEIVPFEQKVFVQHNEQPDQSTDTTYANLAAEMYRMYHWLNDLSAPIEYHLTLEQTAELSGYFADGYHLTLGDLQMPVSFDPIVKRMAVTLLRIGMIIRMWRYWEDEVSPALEKGEKVEIPAYLECTDEEFQLLMTLIDVLLYHAIYVHELLPGEDVFIEETDDPASNLLAALPKSFTTADAKKLGEEMGISKRSVDRIISEWLKEKVISKIYAGHFVKIS